MIKIVIASVSGTILSNLVRASDEIKESYTDNFELEIFYVASNIQNTKNYQLQLAIKNADLVILDLMGTPQELVKVILESCETSSTDIVSLGGKGALKKLAKLGDFKMSSSMMGKSGMAEKDNLMMNLNTSKDSENYFLICKYLRSSHYRDILNMLFLILSEYGGEKTVPKPQEPTVEREIGICDPEIMKYYNTYNDYTEDHLYERERSTVAVLYSGGNYPNYTAAAVGKIVKKLEKRMNIIPIAFTKSTVRKQEELRDFLFNTIENKQVDMIVNFMPFRLGAGPMGGDADGAVNVLKELKVPILHPFFMTRRKIKDWKNSKEGLNTSEFLVTLMMPELDGCIDNIIVGALNDGVFNKKHCIELNDIELIDERVERLIYRIEKWLILRKKPNSEKKVAIIGYNYPPGEANLFGGAFLDTFESISNITKILEFEKYDLAQMSAQDLMDSFTQKIINSGEWIDDNDSMIKYDKQAYDESLETEIYKKTIVEQWGESPGDVMSDKNSFLIPGIINGNLFVGLQPTRGIHENVEKAYHDKELLPTHQYIAFYKWLKEEFKADVIIHIGTHGTIEFLGGKESGMSGDCFPDKLIDDMPHLYLYYCGNPSEAMIAKRRSHGTLVSYQPPTYKVGELYGGYLNLEVVLNEYEEAKWKDTNRLITIENVIKEKAEELNLNSNDFEEIEKELYRMKRSLIPYGLHKFGESYREEEAIDYMKFILRYDRGKIKSIRRLLAENSGIDYDVILKSDKTELLTSLDVEAGEYIDSYFYNSNIEFYSYINDEIKNQFRATIDFGISCYQTSKINNEFKGLISGLSGEYIDMKLAGDSIRSPEVFPSGSNLYQFDPLAVPSEAAVCRGAEIADNTINNYVREHGEYPNSVAIILWGLETSRTQGETVGQILSYLGVDVKRNGMNFEPEYEIIPLEKLGRSRIDITINMCGFFRDMFPNIVDDFNRIFKRIYELDECDEDNFFKANSNKIYIDLLDKGYNHDQARELSYSRLFGPAEGEYGTGISKLIETKNWTDEEDIGQMFIDNLKHVYSKNYRGYESEYLLNQNLKCVDIVSQIRSNHEYEVTDLDHYYEYFGGLSKSVEMIKGKKAKVYITDTTGEKIETEGVNKSIERGVRTRLLNPKWIDGMLEHKYHGVQKIHQRFENILGLAATTNSVKQWIFDELMNLYVDDDVLRKRMIENNKWAYNNIIESMLEYNQRGYWDASDEEITKLKERFLEIEGELENT